MALTETVEGGADLSLPHQSLGNTYIELISEVVKDLPGVTRLNLRDNRLTDVGVQEIVEAICGMDGHRGIQVEAVSGLQGGVVRRICSPGRTHRGPYQSCQFVLLSCQFVLLAHEQPSCSTVYSRCVCAPEVKSWLGPNTPFESENSRCPLRVGYRLCFSGMETLLDGLSGLSHADAIKYAAHNLAFNGKTSSTTIATTQHLLQVLDLSENKLDTVSAQSLCAFLKSPTCCLREILLAKADIDDGETAIVMEVR